jgi:sarcosine/dimethylglycine N-methyltransferase
VDAATYLTERTGLQKRVSFDCGDALALPYSDASFDIVVTQHVAMNIEDRERFYCEAYRVLKPGGQFALYDVTAGEGMQPHFPVPWADSSATSFLKSQAELRDILQRQGFAVLKWLDRSADTITWFEAFTAAQSRYSADGSTMNAGAGGEPRPLNLSLVVGADFGARVDNLIRSLKENKVTVTEAILRK